MQSCQSPSAAVAECKELLLENRGASWGSSGLEVGSGVSSRPQGSERGSFLVSPACGVASRPQLSSACRHIPPAPTSVAAQSSSPCVLLFLCPNPRQGTTPPLTECPPGLGSVKNVFISACYPWPFCKGRCHLEPGRLVNNQRLSA